eukprot:363222-Chlamydomonas_euryale.AAC.2
MGCVGVLFASKQQGAGAAACQAVPLPPTPHPPSTPTPSRALFAGENNSGLVLRLAGLQKNLAQERVGRKDAEARACEAAARVSTLEAQLASATRSVGEMGALLEHSAQQHDARAELVKQVCVWGGEGSCAGAFGRADGR